MKILHVTPTYYPAIYWGGPIFSVFHLNNALAQLPGVELRVLTTDSSGPKVSDRLSEEEKSSPFPYSVIFTRRIAGACVSIGLLRQLPKQVRWADLVHLTATFSFPTVPTLFLCRLYNKPVMWSPRGAIQDDLVRGSFDDLQSKMTPAIKSLWLKICGLFIQTDRVTIHATTDQEREATEKVFSKTSYAIIPNGVESPTKLPAREGRLPDGKLRLMFMGRLAPKKGVENLLQAIAKVSIPVSLDVYGSSTIGQGGSSYGEDLIKLAKQLDILDSKVRFCGQAKGEAKNRAYLEADVCVIPSYSENFCIVVAEALSMGMPVIVSDSLAWGEVEVRGCGLVVGNDPDSLAKAIHEISRMELSDMGEKGWQWMKEAYGWQGISRAMGSIYENLIRSVRDAR